MQAYLLDQLGRLEDAKNVLTNALEVFHCKVLDKGIDTGMLLGEVIMKCGGLVFAGQILSLKGFTHFPEMNCEASELLEEVKENRIAKKVLG